LKHGTATLHCNKASERSTNGYSTLEHSTSTRQVFVLSQLRVLAEDGSVIVSSLRLAETHWEKFRGLMLDTSLQPDEALLIRNCKAIHCCFMKIAIDVLFVDEQGRISHIISEMRPWSFSPVVREAHDVIECFPGTVARAGLEVGQQLRIVE
jgi:uncharacterized protein